VAPSQKNDAGRKIAQAQRLNNDTTPNPVRAFDETHEAPSQNRRRKKERPTNV